MRKLLLSMGLVAMSISLFGQGQAETYINEALTHIKAKDFKAAQLSLQDAINEINAYIAQEVLSQLPTEINGYKAETSDDQSNSMGMTLMGGGINITRTYNGATNKDKVEINIVANSPLVSSMTALMGNPMMMNGANQKTIRIGSRRAILNKNSETEYDENENEKQVTNYELQVILGQTLVTVKGNGFANEQAFTSFYQKIDFEKIAKTIGE